MNKDDDLFKQAYERFEEQPSPDLWHEINKRLDNKKAARFSNNKNSSAYLAALLLLLLCSLLICKQMPGVKTNRHPDSLVAENRRKANTGAALVQPEAKGKNIAATANRQQNKGLPDTVITSLTVQLSAQNNHVVAAHFNHSEAGIKANPHPAATAKNEEPQNGQTLALSSLANAATEAQASLIPDLSGSFYHSLTGVTTAAAGELDSAAMSKAPTSVLPTDSVTETQQAMVKKNQQTTKKPRKSFEHSWNILPFATADFIYSTLDADDAFPTNNGPEENEAEEKENHKFCFSSGLLFAWRGVRKAGFTTGIVYSKVAIGISPQTLYARANDNQQIGYKFTTSSGYAFLRPGFLPAPNVGDSVRSPGSEVYLHYLSLPFVINYSLPAGKRISIIPGAGVMASLLTGAKGETELSNAAGGQAFTIHKLQGVKPLSVSLLANAEIDYRISRRVHLAILTRLQLPISKTTEYKASDAHQYSFSTGAGLVWTIR